jgi:hypothetical protein
LSLVFIGGPQLSHPSAAASSHNKFWPPQLIGQLTLEMGQSQSFGGAFDMINGQAGDIPMVSLGFSSSAKDLER